MENSMALMSVENGEYYGLNPVGRAIWEQLEKPMRIGEIVKELMYQFKVDKATCEKETGAFLAELEKRKIIEINEEVG